MKVVFASAARADLVRIGEYIATDSPTRARSFVRAIREAALQIGEAPRGFALVPRYEASGVRRRPYGDYLLFYRIEEDRVVVIRILHGAQDYGRLLFPED